MIWWQMNSEIPETQHSDQSPLVLHTHSVGAGEINSRHSGVQAERLHRHISHSEEKEGALQT